MFDKRSLIKIICTAAAVLAAIGTCAFTQRKLDFYKPAVPAYVTISDEEYFEEEFDVIDPQTTASQAEVIDLNAASVNEIAAIEGVTWNDAEKIVSYRNENGAFSSLDDLKNIEGISEQTLKCMEDCVFISAETVNITVINIVESDTYAEEAVTEYSAEYADTVCTAAEETVAEYSAEYFNIIRTASETVSSAEKETVKADEQLIDLNTASADELTRLNGIGEVTAEKIIEYRNNNGGFSSIEELLNVNGIGEKKFSDIKDKVYVSSSESVGVSEGAIKTSKAATSTKNANGLVNINTAGLDELMSLNGIGETIANRIIEYREENGGFSSINELLNVKGIGDKKFESICNYICV